MGSSGWKDRELGCDQGSRFENGRRSQIPSLEVESGSCSRNQGVRGLCQRAWPLRWAVSAPRAQ